MADIEHGCLLIADISGYGEYQRGVELEHSTDVLADLLGTLVDQISATFTVSKLEGDAVFVYEPGRCDRHRLLETITGTYVAFMRRQRTIVTLTTCGCDACRGIPNLGLKFVVHRGDYAVQQIAGNDELVSSDVVLVHRLLKNTVRDATGLRDYALFSAAAVGELAIDPVPLGWTSHAEISDDLGMVATWIEDLDACWRSEQAARTHVIAPDTKSTLECELSAPPPVVWDYLADPAKQLLYMADRVDQHHPNGTRGVGTTTHCVHGSAALDTEVLDWVPYEYSAVHLHARGQTFLFTCELHPLGADRTRLVARVAPAGGVASRALFPATKRLLRREYRRWMDNLDRLLLANADHEQGL